MATYWRKRLRTASFRKIRFNLTNADTSFGRRVVGHSFPKRDEPYSEDMGRKSQEFTIEAFIAGFDYQRLRDKLIKACETPGPGKLIHPYYGNKNVVCTGCEVREAAGEGGIARFNLTFREAGTLRFPGINKKAKGVFGLFGADGVDKAIADFTDKFSVANEPQFLVDTAEAQVEAFVDALETSTGFITREADAIADLAFSIQNIRDDISSLLDAPSLLADRMSNALGLLRDATLGRDESLKVYKSLFAFGSPATFSNFNTAARDQETQNKKAMNSIVKRMAFFYGAQDLAEIEFVSVQDAQAERLNFFNQIDDLSNEDNVTDDIYQLLQQMRAEIANAVPRPDESLPEVVTLVPEQTTDSLTLSYDLYESLERESDIVDRNNVKNPAVITGGQALEVLRDG